MPTFIDYILLTIITIFPVLSLGIMLFFSFVIAPTVHKFLPKTESGPYIRKIFPIYYILNGFLSLSSLLAIAYLGVFNAIFYANLVILVIFILSYFYLMPSINKIKFKNSSKFKILHGGSVILNIIQIFLLITITFLLLAF
jgi:hypothetical protein